MISFYLFLDNKGNVLGNMFHLTTTVFVWLEKFYYNTDLNYPLCTWYSKNIGDLVGHSKLLSSFQVIFNEKH